MKKVFSLLMPYLAQQKLKVLTYIVVTTIVSICSLATPLLNGYFIDFLMNSNDMQILYNYAAIMLALMVINICLSFFVQRLFTTIQATTAYELNKAVIIHIQNSSLTYLQRQDPIYLTQIINGDANSIATFAVTIIQNVTVNLLNLIIPFIIFIKLNIAIGATFFFLFIAYFFLFNFFKKKLYNGNKKLSEIKSQFFSRLCEPMVSGKFYKLNEVKEVGIKKLNSVFCKVLKQSLNLQNLNCWFSASDQVVSTIAQVILFVVGGGMVILRKITIGTLTILLSYFNNFMSGIKYFYSLGSTYQGILVSYNRIASHFAQPIEHIGTQKIQEINSINLQNLSFSYEKQDSKLVFPDTHFSKGQMYTISGINGAGKTTLTLLLCGLYIEEFEGNIEINNQTIRDLDMAFLRQHKIAYADQDAILLKDTICNNIIMGLSGKSIEDVFSLNHRLRFFSDQMIDTVLEGEEISNASGKLSGGERQKISLMRAFLKDSDLLILDEPTSFLDESSRIHLVDYLNEIKENKIILIITHDLQIQTICDQNYCI